MDSPLPSLASPLVRVPMRRRFKSEFDLLVKDYHEQ
jgi:hypothetical protein